MTAKPLVYLLKVFAKCAGELNWPVKTVYVVPFGSKREGGRRVFTISVLFQPPTPPQQKLFPEFEMVTQFMRQKSAVVLFR